MAETGASASPYSGAQTRRNVLAFVMGKLPTAALTAATLGMTAHALSTTDYGHYVLALAALELLLGFSALGLDWTLLRYLPLYRSHGARGQLLRMWGTVLGLRFLVLLAVCGALILAQTWVGNATGLPAALLWPFVALVLIEGLARVCRDHTLEALGAQALLQGILVARGLLTTACLGYLLWQPQAMLALHDMMYIELLGAALSLVLAALATARVLRAVPTQATAWQPPPIRQIARNGLANYFSGCIEYLYSPSSMLLLLARLAPPTSVAGVGFVLRLTEIIRNYVPSMMLLGVVRPRMLGSYAQHQNYTELRAWAEFLFKYSTLMLLPICAGLASYGEVLLNMASGHKYGHLHLLLTVLTLWLVLRLHRLIQGVVFNALELMGEWLRATAISLLALPVCFALGTNGLGVWFVALALCSNELLMLTLCQRALRRQGRTWTLGRAWLPQATLASLLAALVGALPTWLWTHSWTSVMLGLTGLLLVYVAALWGLGVVSEADRVLINRAAGRSLFKTAA